MYRKLTFMLGLLDQFTNHGLDDSNVSIWPVVSQQSYILEDHKFSLKNPPKVLPARASQKLVEKPTMSKDISVPAHPISRTGFRPIRSDTPPQAKPVKASARAKEEMKMQAQKDALDLSPTWKSFTMTQA